MKKKKAQGTSGLAIQPANDAEGEAEIRLDHRLVEPSPLEQTFHTLAAEWRAETEDLSDMQEVLMHPAYQRIIGLGPSVVPLILRELQCRPSLWFWALKMITGDDPVPPGAETMKQVREAWLEYGRHRGYL